MAGHGDGDMPHLPFAFSGIMGKRHNAFLVGGYDSCGDMEVLPQNLAMACAFRLDRTSIAVFSFGPNPPREPTCVAAARRTVSLRPVLWWLMPSSTRFLPTWRLL